MCLYSLAALVSVSTSNNYCIMESALVTLSVLKREAEKCNLIVNVGLLCFGGIVRHSFRGSKEIAKKK